MITVTDAAIKQFQKLLAEQDAADGGIRIFIQGGGCCGPALAMDIVDDAKTGDATLKLSGLRIFIAKDAGDALSNATIDFADQRGFIITGMPRSSCCG